jgi:hypothetical protein
MMKVQATVRSGCLYWSRHENRLDLYYRINVMHCRAGQGFGFGTTQETGQPFELYESPWSCPSLTHAALPAGVYLCDRGFQHGDPGYDVVMRLRRLSEDLMDRRRSPRTQANCLQLAYWDGSEGVLRRIREVIVLTEPLWRHRISGVRVPSCKPNSSRNCHCPCLPKGRLKGFQHTRTA